MASFRLPGVLQSGLGLLRGMAGAGRRSARGTGPGDPAGNSRRVASRVDKGMHARRPLLAFLLAACLVGGAQAQVLSTRIWPARDYTRLTIESKEEIKYSIFSLKNPERLVLDLEVGEIPPALADLHTRIAE